MEKNESTSSESKSSRVGVRATLAGIVVTLSLMYFLMSLAAVLGFWSFQFEELPSMGAPFWSVTSAAWIFSVFLGSLISVLVSRTGQMLDGGLQAFVTWAGAYLIFGGLTVAVAESSFYDMVFPVSEVLMRIGFLGDSLSLIAALSSAWFAVRIQGGIENRQIKETIAEERGPRIPIHNSDLFPSNV